MNTKQLGCCFTFSLDDSHLSVYFLDLLYCQGAQEYKAILTQELWVQRVKITAQKNDVWTGQNVKIIKISAKPLITQNEKLVKNLKNDAKFADQTPAHVASVSKLAHPQIKMHTDSSEIINLFVASEF